MVVYLTKRYNMTPATSAMVLYLWSALTNFLPIGGGVLSDVFFGRFPVIAVGCVVSLSVSRSQCTPPVPLAPIFQPN